MVSALLAGVLFLRGQKEVVKEKVTIGLVPAAPVSCAPWLGLTRVSRPCSQGLSAGEKI